MHLYLRLYFYFLQCCSRGANHNGFKSLQEFLEISRGLPQTVSHCFSVRPSIRSGRDASDRPAIKPNAENCL